LTEDVEKEFFKALSMVKSKDSKIYNKDECKFFDNIKTSNGNEEADSKKSSKEKEKKSFYLKDLEREMILKK
jgi:protein KRI1